MKQRRRRSRAFGQAPRYRHQTNIGNHMTDEYRLDIYVVGPAGIDPYNGDRITKPVIN